MAKRKKPMSKRTPWVWSIELVRGCNLSCWHCPARIFPEDGEKRFMSAETWEAACRVMNAWTPRTRLEVAQGGEPTLHPRLLNFIDTTRRLAPTTQLQVTTNGLTLLSGAVKLRDIFAAGAHSVYIDMYSPIERFLELIREARVPGLEWYKYDKPKLIASNPDHRMANTYYGNPDMKLVILQDSPIDRLGWRKVGRLSTFLNHIDWKVAMPWGLVPVRETYERKCTLPMRYVSTSWEGDYIFCCIDFWCESAGLLGNVKDGPGEFREFWFGRLMQSIRRRLADADRAGVPYCSRCNCAFSKCDWTGIWPKGSFDWWWDGEAWKELPPRGRDDDVFADGWKKARRVTKGLPTVDEETSVISSSKRRWTDSKKKRKRFIRSTGAVDPD